MWSCFFSFKQKVQKKSSLYKSLRFWNAEFLSSFPSTKATHFKINTQTKSPVTLRARNCTVELMFICKMKLYRNYSITATKHHKTLLLRMFKMIIKHEQMPLMNPSLHYHLLQDFKPQQHAVMEAFGVTKTQSVFKAPCIDLTNLLFYFSVKHTHPYTLSQ